MSLDTEEIIDEFYIASYDDIGMSREVWKRINEFMADHPSPFNRMTVSEYKRLALDTVVADFRLLQNKIQMTTDWDYGFKYGYYNSIRYILFRWFTIDAPGGPYELDTKIKVPSWYLHCVNLINNISYHCNEARSPTDLIREMLETAQSYRDGCIYTKPWKIGQVSETV